MTEAGAAGSGPWLIVGLGNPGPEYAEHRHNVGAMVLDLLSERHTAHFSANRRVGADIASLTLGGADGHRVRLVRPRSFMNTSGAPVQRATAYEKVPPERLVVVHDELDLPFGAIRLKQGGGDNGHNGLKSIRQALGSGDFFRVRLGIGRPPAHMRPADFVLHRYSASERAALPEQLADAAEAVETLIESGLAAAQNAHHARS